MDSKNNLYQCGQVVRHKGYGYRGVIVAVDSFCRAPEDWYRSNITQPRKDQPWYHVLVSESGAVTYPAESNLIPDETLEPVEHPLVWQYFNCFHEGGYQRNERTWGEWW